MIINPLNKDGIHIDIFITNLHWLLMSFLKGIMLTSKLAL